MKKLVKISLTGASLWFLSASQVFAWLDCPYGKINDPYPGSCDQYVDTNENQICDHSEPAPTKETAKNRFWILFSPLALYFIHWYLTHQAKLKTRPAWLTPLAFNLGWNLVLVISFVISAASGIWVFLATPNQTLLTWHNYAGIVAAEIGGLHLVVRLHYFRSAFSSLTKKS